MCRRGSGGTSSPTLGLKYELRDVGTASPQLCSHIWQGQPFPGSRQMPQAQAAPAVQAGEGWLGFAPLLPREQPWSCWQQWSPDLAPSTRPWPVQVTELAAPTTEPGWSQTSRSRTSVPALVPKPPGFCQMGRGKEVAATPKPFPGTLNPSALPGAQLRAALPHTPSQGRVSALSAFLQCPRWDHES